MSVIETFTCCGVRIAAFSPDEAVNELERLAGIIGGRSVHLCNAYTLALASRDDDYLALLNAASVNLPDGTPLIWSARLQGVPLREPTRGPALMLNVMRTGLNRGATHVLYGGSDELLKQLKGRLEADMPDIRIIAAISPPFRSLTAAEVAETTHRLRSLGSDYVWVGLGTPKQDHFVHLMAARVPSVFVAVGAAFDFAAGTKAEAPSYLHGSGFEWIHRLAHEPRRLGKRYLVGNARFVTAAIRSHRS